MTKIFLAIARNFEENPVVHHLRCLFSIKRENSESQFADLKEEKPQGFTPTGLVNSPLNGIMEALADPNVNLIGAYGSNGARKASLIEKISRRAKRDNLFDVIAVARVTKIPDLKRIQGEIGEYLGLQFEEETIVGRAKRLCDRIKKEQRVLVVLDDLHAEINLHSLGIPFGNDHSGCKVLFIAESQKVLIGVQNYFLVS